MLALLACIAAFDRWIPTTPNRVELGTRSALVTASRVNIGAAIGPLPVVGAWRLTSPDPRFGGLSALAFDRGALVGITDSGARVRLSLPVRRRTLATIADLPAGPAGGRFRRDRDSESLARDSDGRGWWVGFERYHQLWLYDHQFTRALARIQLPGTAWHVNGGVEAIVTEPDRMLLFVETGAAVIALHPDGRTVPIRLSGVRGVVTDAVALRGGAILAIDRTLTSFGFRTRLVRLDRDGDGLKVAAAVALPLRPTDNLEGIAAEPQPDGSTRLWLVTDDNFQLPLRTLLIALDLPHDAIAKRLQ
jgi:hypothetical protein